MTKPLSGRACLAWLAVFLIAGSFYLALHAAPFYQPDNSDFKITGPFSHKNLSIFLVHGPDRIKSKNLVTLQEAMEKNWVVVHETSDVNELEIENVSANRQVFIQSGDMVKGGKQDRVLAVDFILEPKSGSIPISAFCVEQGRWRQRGGETLQSFSRSDNQIARKDLKLAVKSRKHQVEVWKTVASVQKDLSHAIEDRVADPISVTSFQLSMENEKLNAVIQDYFLSLADVIKGKSDVIGLVCAINGAINSADIYAQHGLFAHLWHKLLKASAVEAVASLKDTTRLADLDLQRVLDFLTQPDPARSREEMVSARIRMITHENDHKVLFETRDLKNEGIWIHRNYIQK